MEGERKRKGFVARCNFHIPARREEWPSELTLHLQKGRKPLVLLPRCAEGQAPFPSPASTGRHTGMRCFFGPLSISGRGMGTTPHGTPCLWGIKLTPLSTNWQPQAPLGETDTVPVRRSWKKTTPQQSPKTIWVPQYATNRLPLSVAAGAGCGTAVVPKAKYSLQYSEKPVLQCRF